MSKIYVYLNEDDEDEITFIAVTKTEYETNEYEEYNPEVLKVMEDLGFGDVMVFTFQHAAEDYEGSLEILKNDPRIKLVSNPF